MELSYGLMPIAAGTRLGRYEIRSPLGVGGMVLKHPNVAHIYEIAEDKGLVYIAMEYIEGETLRQHIKRSRLKTGEVLDIASQLASALAAAHQTGIVHRDIKLENIVLSRDGFLKVLDFGTDLMR